MGLEPHSISASRSQLVGTGCFKRPTGITTINNRRELHKSENFHLIDLWEFAVILRRNVLRIGDAQRALCCKFNNWRTYVLLPGCYPMPTVAREMG